MWLYLSLGIVFLAVGTVFVVGSLLPREHRVSRSAVFTQSPAAVWQKVTALDEAPKWRTDLKSVENLPAIDGKPAWIEHYKSMDLKMVADETQPPRRFVTRIVGDSQPFGGTWTFEIETVAGDTCRLRITEDGFVNPPPFRFISKFIMGHASTMETYLNDLGKAFGSAIVIEP